MLRLNSSLEALLYSTFPALSHAYPRTSPGTTNTDVLFSILLHWLSVHRYFTSLILNGKGTRTQSCFPGFQSRVSPGQGLEKGLGAAVWLHTFKNITPTPLPLFKAQTAQRKQLIRVTHSHLTLKQIIIQLFAILTSKQWRKKVL